MGTSRGTRFGDVLRRYRLAAGLSQQDLAERAGLSTRGVSDLERGLRASPRPDTVRMLADALALGPVDRAALIAAARPELEAPAAPGPAVPTPTPHPAPVAPAPLPVPPTRLVGREAEVARLCALLRREDVRLLTLTGAGGVGKTRLAMATARELATEERFADGVAFVELAPVHDPALVPTAVAAALGVRETGVQSPAALVRIALQERRLLLVLDNCEHLLPAALFVAEVLAGCPDLAVLATSRERLHLRGEREVPIEPLALPARTDPARLPPLEGLAGVAAIRLFAERAEEATPRFALTAENAPAVAELVRRLDGLPLAIELAAAWSRVLTPAALLERLSQRLPMLADGPRDLPDRQQTLRATITWSHDLLRPDERALFRRLSVFAGGCDAAAAEAVARGTDRVLGRDDAGETGMAEGFYARLAALLEKSLVRSTESAPGEPRFSMLETVREYGLEALSIAGEAEAARRAHAVHFLAFAEEAAPRLQGPDQVAWFARFEVEHDNLRAALDWSLSTREADFGLRLCWRLARFWHIRGHLTEGRTWLGRTLAVGRDAPAQVRAWPLHYAGLFAWSQDDAERAVEHLEAALALFRKLGEEKGEAAALGMLGAVALSRGDLAGAAAAYGQSLPLFRAAGNAIGIATVLDSLGMIAHRQGDYGRASALFAEAVGVAREVGDVAGVARILNNTAELALAQGDPVRAAALCRESLALYHQVGFQEGIAYSLGNVAGIALARGRPERAVRLFGAADALRAATGAPLPPLDRPDYERNLAAARDLLGEDGFRRTWAAGVELTVDEAISEALADDTARSSVPAAARAEPGTGARPPTLPELGGSGGDESDAGHGGR